MAENEANTKDQKGLGLEARVGIEPTNKGFADLQPTTLTLYGINLNNRHVEDFGQILVRSLPGAFFVHALSKEVLA